MTSRRSHGRPTPSRGARVERRKATRTPAPDGPHAMTIPDAIRALGPAVTRRSGPARPPCPIDPTCTTDHLKRRGGRG